MMTVKELKKVLNELPNDALVMIASDEEMNTVSPSSNTYTGKIGTTQCFEDPENNYIEGENFIGIDLKKDKGKEFIVLIP